MSNHPLKGERKPIVVTIEGRKKLHPNYTGELELSVDIATLNVNFNPAFMLKLMRLVSF